MVEKVQTDRLASADLADLRRLMDEAFGHRFSEEDWRHALGGTHCVVRDPEGTIVSHAAVVGRQLTVAHDTLSTGYVEAVATHPRFRRKGLASEIMGAVGELINARFRMGALSASIDFYEKLGWIRWRGRTWCRKGEEVFRTADEDGGVWVLPTASTPAFDLEADLIAEWRPGDVW